MQHPRRNASTQPGGSLYGLNNSNPFNPDFEGRHSGLGQVPGGVITFGGGVALYKDGKVIGGLGVSGDSSCADHAISYRMRLLAGYDGIQAAWATPEPTTSPTPRPAPPPPVSSSRIVSRPTSHRRRSRRYRRTERAYLAAFCFRLNTCAPDGKARARTSAAYAAAALDISSPSSA